MQVHGVLTVSVTMQQYDYVRASLLSATYQKVHEVTTNS